MENLLFSLNATLPIFFTMMLGWFFRKVGLMDEDFVNKLNKFLFTAALPVMLFNDLAGVDFIEVWDTTFVIFCFSATLVSILTITALSYLLKNRTFQSEFIQASYRSSAAILGISFIQNMYGNTGMAPLMIIATVPLYNVMAVIILSLMKPERDKLSRKIVISALKGILINPIILGILAGIIWSAIKIPMPAILEKTLNNVGVVGTPLGLMAMGTTINIKKIKDNIKLSLISSFIKLIVLPAIFLPIAISFGFSHEKLVAILIMLGSATTVSCYIMARNMGHDGTLTSSTIMLSTLLSAFTLTAWIFIIKTINLI